MKLLISNIRLSLDDDPARLPRLAARRLKLTEKDIRGFSIVKESVDARKKSDIGFVYSVKVETAGRVKLPSDPDIRVYEEPREELFPGKAYLPARPVVVGTGPAGLFAGLVLARNGYRPLVLERGEEVFSRSVSVRRYWTEGDLDPESNVQFGEGGAGTFSDGKLTTRISDRKCDTVLRDLAGAGAPQEILYKAKPHIGSENLKKVVAALRAEILALGGEVRFGAKMTGLEKAEGRVRAVTVNGTERIETSVVVLAIGHSARDTFEMLHGSGVVFVPKPFSIGVRIEHPQDLIDRAQYGAAAGHPRLGAADYHHFHRTAARTVYSFCMCPGGLVVASATEAGMIVTNGMSEFERDRENANAAFVVSVEPSDFGSGHPLAGVEFQRYWERRAFGTGGGDGAAPVQLLGDFVQDAASSRLGSVKPSYTGAVRPADINTCLPGFVRSSMKEALSSFNRRIEGFSMPDAVCTGIESRTSSPVRITRGETLEAEGIAGLYPAGEGAGYAGGIMSAAVDGIRIAEQIIRTWARPL